MPGSKPKPVEWVRNGECMIVVGRKPKKDGYFRVSIGPRGAAKEIQLHRLVCERRHGKLGDLMATHTCDNRGCINPNHLVPGTGKENMAGAVARNRTAFGSKCGKSILTEGQVLEIIQSTERTKDLAIKYNVHRCTIGDIRHNRTWRRQKNANH